VYTGNGQFTVTDSYSCNSPPCGSFDVVDPTSSSQLAAPVVAPSSAGAAEKGVRPTPAHLILTAHALTFGFLSATGKLLEGDDASWTKNFASDATEAAETVTPLGGYILKSSFEK
jgi:hypothetical protein